MSASARGQRATIGPKTGSANTEAALNPPLACCNVSCRGSRDAIGWCQTCFEHHPYPLELLLRVVSVSLETMKIVNGLPKLEI